MWSVGCTKIRFNASFVSHGSAPKGMFPFNPQMMERADPGRREGLSLTDSRIRDLTKYGIAVHHAGLDLHDRKMIEDGFKSGILMLLCSTSVRLETQVLHSTDVLDSGSRRQPASASGCDQGHVNLDWGWHRSPRVQ